VRLVIGVRHKHLHVLFFGWRGARLLPFGEGFAAGVFAGARQVLRHRQLPAVLEGRPAGWAGGLLLSAVVPVLNARIAAHVSAGHSPRHTVGRIGVLAYDAAAFVRTVDMQRQKIKQFDIVPGFAASRALLFVLIFLRRQAGSTSRVPALKQ